MPDVMMFPETVEEFMESYKVVDGEHVYSNGVEFVPIYRMRQWFQHQPERKKGKWIPITDHEIPIVFKCTMCGWLTTNNNSFAFCPNCGAAMTEGET